MRLWHKYLLPVLPREQLISQWRELSAIAGAIQKHGTPNHLLVNFILDYDFDHLISYTQCVRIEMEMRGYKVADNVWQKIVALKPNYTLIRLEDIYSGKMDYNYFMICYCNLLEKYMCGGIEPGAWKRIEKIAKILYRAEKKEAKTMNITPYITMDSFGDYCPVNWEEIADYLNARINKLIEENDGLTDEYGELTEEGWDILAGQWESYCEGEFLDAPKPIYPEYNHP